MQCLVEARRRGGSSILRALLTHQRAGWNEAVAGLAAPAAASAANGSILYASGQLSRVQELGSLAHVIAAPRRNAGSALPISPGGGPAAARPSAAAAAAASDSSDSDAELPEPAGGTMSHPKLEELLAGLQRDQQQQQDADSSGKLRSVPRAKRRVRGDIQWSPDIREQVRAFWRKQGVTSDEQLLRIERWAQKSYWFRDVDQLETLVQAWRDAGREAGFEEAVLPLMLGDISIIDRGLDPARVIRNYIVLAKCFQQYGIKATGLRRSRLLQNRTETILERIPKFLREVTSWPYKINPIKLLDRAPGLLTSHSDHSLFLRRIKAMEEWLPTGLDPGRLITVAPTLLNTQPHILLGRYLALQEASGLETDQFAQAADFAPTLLSRRPEVLAWKVKAHKEFSKVRKAAGFGDEIAEWFSEAAGEDHGQFPSRFCNLLMQPLHHIGRLSYLVEEVASEKPEVLMTSGYTRVRMPPKAWDRDFPGFAQWWKARPQAAEQALWSSTATYSSHMFREASGLPKEERLEL